MTTQNKPLAKQGKRELREWLQGEEFKRELAGTLPRTMSPERFVRIAFQATYRNPDLLNCSQESFFNCLLQLSAMGLEPDGRRAHLIPFKDNKAGSLECSLIVDYKGIKELVRRNRDVSAMHGDVVGENDQFEVRYGTRGILDHVPSLQNRGRIYCAYSYVKLPDGSEEFDVMSIDEIESIRKRSKSPNKGPWVTDWNEMAKKTVFRRHAKGLPLSPETRDALERDSDADALTDVERFNAAAPARASVLGRAQRQMPENITPQNDAELGVDKPESAAEPPNQDQPTESQKMSAEPPSLQSQVQKKLTEAGYNEAELLHLMKPLRMAPKEAQSLNDVAEHHLARVLEEWENALDRLKQEREGTLAP